MTLLIFMYALFGSSFAIGKVLLGYTTPLFLTGARMTLGGAILLAYQYFMPFARFKFRSKHWWYYLQIVMFGIYFAYILRFWALNYMPSLKLCFLFNFSPFFAAFYSYIFFKERITPMQLLGLLIGFIGFIPILAFQSGDELGLAEWAYISLPELAGIASVGMHSYGWIVMRKLIKYKGYDPAMINGLSMAAGGVLALMTSLPFDGLFPVSEPASFFSWLALIILISNVICHNLYGYLLTKYTATFVSFAGFSGSLFAALYGWAFLGERITWHFWASAITVFTGLYIFYRHEGNKQRPSGEIEGV